MYQLLLAWSVLLVQTACNGSAPDADQRAGQSADEIAMPASGTTRLSGLLGSQDSGDFERALEPRSFTFPADHAAHPAFRNEWWYLSGNLDARDDGDRSKRFGFEFTLFRFSLSAESLPTESGWRTNQIFVGHLAVTDVGNETFYSTERYSRGALGLAGARKTPFRVWLEDWQIAAMEASTDDVSGDGPDEAGRGSFPWQIIAGSDEFGIDLLVDPLKPLVLNGDKGLSRKSAEPGNASFYYSMSRLATQGTLRLGSDTYSVDGLSWLDREWSSSALSATQSGWDWFALQLDDNTELMFYQLRKLDGSADSFSGGTYVRQDGRAISLTSDEVLLEVKDYWTNSEGDRYPAEWRLRVPKQGIDLQVVPVMQAQELQTIVRYWEGAVDVSGRVGDGTTTGTTTGRGYVELTGYARR